MTEAEIRQLACEILSDIAPDTDPAMLPGGKDIREGLDIDSMDFLNFIIALSKRAGVAIACSYAIDKHLSKIAPVATTSSSRLGVRVRPCLLPVSGEERPQTRIPRPSINIEFHRHFGCPRHFACTQQIVRPAIPLITVKEGAFRQRQADRVRKDFLSSDRMRATGL